MKDIPTGSDPQSGWERLQYFRQMSGADRVEMVVKLTEEKRIQVCAAVRANHPEYSDEEVKFAEIRLRIGDDLFSKAFPAVNLAKCECCESHRWDS